MVDVAETIKERSEWISTEQVDKKIIIGTTTVSQNDTITIGELTAIGSAHLWLISSGAEYTCTVATNVITVTQAVTDAAVGFVAIES